MHNNMKQPRSATRKSPAAIEISRAIEVPGGGTLEVVGEGYLIKAPKGTAMAAIHRAIQEFLWSEKAGRN